VRARLPRHARSAGLLGGLAIVGLVVVLMSAAEAAKPAIGGLKAQRVSKDPRRGIAVVGYARGKWLRLQYAGGCRNLKLRHSSDRKRRFAAVVRRNGKVCLAGAVPRGRVRAQVCDGERCTTRQIRLSPFRDSDGDGLGNLSEIVKKNASGQSGPGSAPGTPGTPDAPPEVPLPPFAQLGCVEGAVEVASAAELLDQVEAGNDVCVTAPIGNVSVEGFGPVPDVTISSKDAGGSIGELAIEETSSLTIQGARVRSLEIRRANGTQVRSNIIGGTQSNRVLDQLIFMPEASNDVAIESNDIGWTVADDSGNTGYGCRCYGNLDRLRFVGNKVHDIAADGFQGVGGEDVLIDRNEIGPVGRNPESSEHSDNIQITGNDANLRITNNWIHHQGYYEGSPIANSGSTYIHGGSTASLIYENNLIETAEGRTEICGLGTGGKSRSNITIRRNTWVGGGGAFTGFPGFEWDCTSGSGNTVKRNISVDPDGGFALGGSASAATFSANLWGKPNLVTLDAARNCTSANCNPSGQEPIGYRKPPGVHW
jgi:hypothetical protein